MLLQQLYNITIRFEENCKQFLIDPLFPNFSIKQKLDIYKELSKELTIGESEYNFINVAEEIKYYKYDKPEFLKYGVFYKRIGEIETNRPLGDKKYYKKVLKNMKKEYETMKESITYFRTGENDKDEKLFSRKSDQNHIFGLIKGLHMVEKYLMDKEDNSTMNKNTDSTCPLNWTGSLNQYNEMLNGLDELRVINNGEISLTQLNYQFGKMLNVNVKDIHSGTNEILKRKEPARFGLSLVDAIYNKRDRLLEKDIERRRKGSIKR